MEYKIADHIAAMKPSAIREIFKVLVDPTVISLAAGSPDPVSFPNKEMAKIGSEIFLNEADVALQYGTTEGYPKLRELTAKRMKEKYNVGTDNDDILITTGGQQSISLFTQVMLNPGDVVISEDPSFIGALNGFRSMNSKLMSVPMDDEGMRMDKLEELLQTTPNVKFIYVIPTFQNPTGRTMSLERRKELLAMAKKYDVLIVEDNPYFELRYEGEFVPTIKSMDTEGRVIYCGSYSKVLYPGMRLGYCIAAKEIINRMVVCKQVSDVHTTILSQIICSEFLKRVDFDAHLARLAGIYRHKCGLMLSELDKKVNPSFKYTRPQGGLFIWMTLPEGVDMMEFCRRCAAEKVAVVPGSASMVSDDVKTRSVRLNFSTPTDEQIVKGVDILGRISAQY